MGGASIWHWIVFGIIVMLLIARVKISEKMGDVAKGIKAFKKGMSEDETPTASTTSTTTTPQPTGSDPVRTIEHQPAAGATTTAAATDRRVG